MLHTTGATRAHCNARQRTKRKERTRATPKTKNPHTRVTIHTYEYSTHKRITCR